MAAKGGRDNVKVRAGQSLEAKMWYVHLADSSRNKGEKVFRAHATHLFITSVAHMEEIDNGTYTEYSRARS
jgi:hypothetical protein